ncbi:alpha-2-macroglobulin family protein [Desulfobacula toluolica]|uniref:Uncharacterized lipoprotein n=1 Tax=Desulfobacula toluolica (strain DSM 7467 / Tol2) TaxID=651182 RepID=K0N9P2_DESTT|nr:MG2 domain-containing protein [Desulfobacula toluolica]CCK80679.1 uncharacterized lipoprotein [Desulfobacula toluolica Tol2]
MKNLKWLLVCLIALFFTVIVHADNKFVARFAGQQTVDGVNALAVTFSDLLDPRQNLESYFSLFAKDDHAVEGSWVLSKDLHVVYFSNIEPDTDYVIKIHKGLKSVAGQTLETAQKYSIKTREVQPMISFGSKGFILASKLNRGLPVNALNIDKADIDFFRVKPGFLDEFSQRFANNDTMAYYNNKRLHTYADLVYSGRWDLKVNKDLRTQVNLPITHIKELGVPGIYFAVLKGAGHYNYSFSSTWFTISDLGLYVKKYKNRLQFHVQSLETAKPLKNVTVEGYDKKGKKRFTVDTDKNGIASINGATEHLNYILARSGKSVSFLPMDMPALDLSEFRTAIEPFRPIDLFVYGPRDLYRPGETLVIDALLRNQDGKMTPAKAVTANVIQPDGRVVYEFQWNASHLNHYHYEYHLPADAVTGKWRITFKMAAVSLKEYSFIVADFLPERMKLQVINPKNQTDILGISDTPVIELKGDFLYGAPAAGVRADAMIHIRPARKLFKEKWPGYEFGDATHNFKHSYQTDSIVLDKNGMGKLTIENEWEDTASPLWLTANASVYDSGGRPVVRNKSWQIWPSDELVGIRVLSRDGQIKSDSTAQFEIIVVNKQGERIKSKGLKAVVIKENREYYWEYSHDNWQWHYTRQFYTVDKFNVDVPENGAAKVSVPVKWGGYRLEIKDPSTGLVSSLSFWAGWQPDGMPSSGGGNRPDRVDLTLDKPHYGPGDTAKVMVKAPEAGSGYLFVESDTNLLTLPIKVPAEGKAFDIKIDPSWNRHDLYISALIVRKGQSRTGTLPKRSVGLIHLPLDRTGRKLSLKMDVPKKIEPSQTMDVFVDVSRANGSIPENAYVTLAAVDIGILNLTGFKTPSPHDYFFQKRKYGAQIHDVYQKLIEANKGAWATQRFGGDVAALTRGGDKPATDVQIVSISRNAVKVDEKGRAHFSLFIPEFNGSIRVMATAYTGQDYGSLEQEVTVASALVTQITMPRFLSMGDKSQVVIDVHNLTLTRQQLDMNLDVQGPVKALGQTSHKVSLDPNQKNAFVFPVFSEQQLGRSKINLFINGLVVDGKKQTLNRTWFIDTRPAYPATTKVFRSHLKPGETFDIKPSQMNSLIKETIGVQAVISAFPPINLSDHIQQLNAYPYGCLEQITSGIYPHVILNAFDIAELGLTGQTSEQTNKKVVLGIQRLMEKQKTTGGFGLWSAKSPESYWLTAYVTDFLLHAQQAGYKVPPTALAKALDRLKKYVKRPSTIRPMNYTDKRHYRAATRVYAAFVLARVQGISLGDARALYNAAKNDLTGTLGFVHAGLALYLSGDDALGASALEKALNNSREHPRENHIYYGDYGSDIRDLAAACYLVSSFYPSFEKASHFLFGLQDELYDRQWLSTQERNALVLAGSIAVKNSTELWQARISAGDKIVDLVHDRQKQFVSVDGQSADGFKVLNTAGTDLYLSVTLAGYPAQKPRPEAYGVKISRRYLTPAGIPIEMPVKSGQFKSGDRLLVELAFTADKRMPNGLIVDLLPACLELEDPNLAGSMVIDEIQVDTKTVVQWHNAFDTRHTEYRDDRFVAALNIPAQDDLRIFYPVRIVSPGDYLVPPPLAEDMYKPYIRGIGSGPALMQVSRP